MQSYALHCIHTKKLNCLKSGVEFDMNDILYEFKNLHHFKDSLTFGVKAVLERSIRTAITTPDSSKQCFHRSSIRMSACWVLYCFLKPQRNGDNLSFMYSINGSYSNFQRF